MIIITRAKSDSERIKNELRKVPECPKILIEPLAKPKFYRKKLEIPEFANIIITSKNAVPALLKARGERSVNWEIITIGPETAKEFKACGFLRVDAKYNGIKDIEIYVAQNPKKEFFYLRAKEVTKSLAREFANVQEFIVYEIIRPNYLGKNFVRLITQNIPKAIIFFSSLTYINFEKILKNSKIDCGLETVFMIPNKLKLPKEFQDKRNFIEFNPADINTIIANIKNLYGKERAE